MARVVVPDDSPPVLASSRAFPKLLERTQVDYYDSLPGSEERLIERVRDAEIVLNIRSSCRFSERVFTSCPRLKLLSIWGTGTDNVDLGAAAAHGITVTNTPAVSAASIAEHALALMLAAARGIAQLDRQTRQGEWKRGQGVELSGKTLGIVGLGAVGRRFARIGEGIGMRVIAWTFHPDPALGIELVPLEQLLQVSDVISLHPRLSERTRAMIGRRELEQMKPTAILVNTARGPIVDEEALVEALARRRIAAAGLDVFETEPLPAGHPLTRLDNVVLTPHCAGITPEALEAGLELCIANVWNFLSGAPTNIVPARAAGG
ncbi:MAG: glycerate dehydrogenase [Acidobacteria bacterium]|nr:glycerate dehydrogenase [Acidobacteriota bacterium]